MSGRRKSPENSRERVERRSQMLRSFVRSNDELPYRYSRLIDLVYRAVVVANKFFEREFHRGFESQGVASRRVASRRAVPKASIAHWWESFDGIKVRLTGTVKFRQTGEARASQTRFQNWWKSLIYLSSKVASFDGLRAKQNILPIETII